MNMKLSIIIPLYNCCTFIVETLESCLRQTYSNIEVIVVDDFSTDEGLEVVQNYIVDKQCTDVYIIRNECNLGMMRTVNKGIKKSTGQYIMVLGCDDLLPPDYVEKALPYLSEKTAFVFCNPYYVNECSIVTGIYQKDESIFIKSSRLLYELGKNCVIPSVGLIMDKKKLIEAGLYSTKFKNYGEWDLWIRLATLGNISFCPNVHSYYRRHSQNLTNSFKNTGTKNILEEYWRDCRKLALHVLPYSSIQKIQLKLYSWHMNGIFIGGRLMNFKKICKQTIKLCLISPIIKIRYVLALQIKINIADISETMQEILISRRSVARFGDGEFCLMRGKSIRFQDADAVLKKRLCEISKSPSKKDCMICVPYALKDMSYLNESSYEFWLKFRRNCLFSWYALLKISGQYYTTEINRPFKDFKDRTHCLRVMEQWKRVWSNQDIVIIEGKNSKMGVYNDLLDGCKSVKRIIMPDCNAWAHYDELLSAILNLVKRESLLLVSLGPTATVLAYDLSKKGYRIIDIGHIDGEYEASRKYGSNSDVRITEYDVEKNHRRVIHDRKVEDEYLNSIIYEIQ